MTTLAKVRELVRDYCVDAREDGGCSKHPDAPHGFNRNQSHCEDRYVCDCEYWQPDPANSREIASACVEFVLSPELDELVARAQRTEDAEARLALQQDEATRLRVENNDLAHMHRGMQETIDSLKARVTRFSLALATATAEGAVDPDHPATEELLTAGAYEPPAPVDAAIAAGAQS